MRKTVVAALLYEKNRILICQRRCHQDFPGQWEFPGGKIEPGENAQGALQRELQEELGIVAEVGEEVWRAEHQYPGQDPLLLLFFVVRQYRGSLQNRVFQQVRWEAPAELLHYDFLEADCPLVQTLAAGTKLGDETCKEKRRNRAAQQGGSS